MKNIILIFAFIFPFFFALNAQPPRNGSIDYLTKTKPIDQVQEHIPPHRLFSNSPFIAELNLADGIPLPDYLFRYSWDDSLEEWKDNGREDYKYIEGNVKEIVFSSINHEDTIALRKLVWLYNDKWMEQEIETYTKEDDTWKLTERSVYNWDEYDNLVWNAYHIWNDATSQWDTLQGNLYEYEYNELGKPDRITSSVWLKGNASGQYTPISQVIYSYDQEGQWSEVLLFEHEHVWVLQEIRKDYQWYNFEEEKPLEYKTYFAWEEDTILARRSGFEYNEAGDLSLKLVETLDALTNTWRPLERDTYFFDEQNNFIGYQIEYNYDTDYDEMTITYGSKFYYKWNDDRSPSEMITTLYYDNSGEEYNSFKTVYGYDDNTSVNVPLTRINRFARIYPNPVSNQVHLELKDELPEAVVRIYNSTGQLMHVHQGLSGTTTILDIGYLPQGFYFINIISGNQKQIIKLVKR